MPESIPSLPEVRCFALEEFTRKRAAPETSKSQCHGRRTSPIRINSDRIKTRGRGARTNPTQSTEPPPQPASRKPGSSIYYGVRFRPDLNKWVAEIRVAEWKAVDKKVWLGTFDTEKGAARGVDLARKLLKCKKKHGFNLPCPKLDAYSGKIPANLILSDVTTNSMFKAATLFIKRECQEYAASFHDDSPSAGSSLTTPDHHGPQYFQQPPGNMFNHMAFQANSFDSEIVDDVGNENSDSDLESSMMPDLLHNYTNVDSESISINDYLNDDYVHMQMTMGRSPSSCTSTTSCMTFEHALHDQQCMDMAEMSSGPSSLIAEFGDAGCIMSTRMIQGDMQGGIQVDMQGAVSQECWAEAQCTWPGPVSSSSALAPLPGSFYDMTPYMSYVDVALMDCDDLSLQNFHIYPFQHGSTGWF